MEVAQCPSYAAALGYTGVAAAVCLSNWGSAIGTWKAGISIVHTGIRHPSSVMKNVIPIVMAGVIGIYGLIVAVIISQSIVTPSTERNNAYSTYTGLAHLCAGLCCGVSGLAAGACIGIVGDYGIRANKLFVGMLIMLIFSEALALYGMIVALIVSQHSYSCG
ncbi:predicted protein [Phaeodactylum tricornutum CCAP 1055/1]|uniref:V-type proton ATPase proteolipid subunit n=4 Tax=Phaeodactylum tricornutum TaxID=2850 RepID=B7G7Z7_PHATC|nr:predicted protein [Phaeodactylum tricornutum CCAP 1055/1]EEC45449.1 predicted protein [Phaeodactylum tricornutum CCAP 1055/1]|eukprot:XP_002183231.1 predicted protein [Phaeodactylum tricornutum CCAP 1055/1]